jgi:UDP-glucuronate decarboxylase
MNPEDGRVVSNFIMQCLKNENIKVYGDGEQTRSFMYVHDLVDGLILAMGSDYKNPINIGNPDEFKIKDFAELVREKVLNDIDLTIGLDGLPCNGTDAELKVKNGIEYVDALVDDPKRRKPDIGRAKNILGWEPKFSLDQGLSETIEYFKLLLQEKL